MASYNNITLLGNIGSVQVKTFSNGGKVVEASLATSRRWKDRNDEQHEETQWHRLVIGGQLADVAEKYVQKGDPLFVTGEMTYRTYTTREGEDRTTSEVRVQSLQLLPKGMQEGSARSSFRNGQAAPQSAALQELTNEDDLPFD
jgi:single-strand DNA-binding protein